MPTIRDVAHAADVPAATVSHAINETYLANSYFAEIARNMGRASPTQRYGTILCNTHHAALFNLHRGGNIGTKHPKPITVRVNRL